MIRAKLADKNALKNPNTFKQMSRKAFLKSDDPLAAKATKEIKAAFEKKGGKLTKEESRAILDPYMSGEVGQAPAQPAKMPRPRKPKAAQEIRPMSTTGSIFERVKELQGRKRATKVDLDNMFTSDEDEDESSGKQATREDLENMFTSDEED